jgi:hypothetical protein
VLKNVRRIYTEMSAESTLKCRVGEESNRYKNPYEFHGILTCPLAA